VLGAFYDAFITLEIGEGDEWWPSYSGCFMSRGGTSVTH